MAASQLYRFRVDLSDIDRGVYERLDFRLNMHPSESLPYLLTRVIAYALNVEEGLSFSAEGLGDPDEAPLFKEDISLGGRSLWIEIGNPSARRLHKAAKAARRVLVYTYKNPESMLSEVRGANVHKSENIEFYALAPEFLEGLGAMLDRDNQWSIMRADGTLTVGTAEGSETGELHQVSL